MSKGKVYVVIYKMNATPIIAFSDLCDAQEYILSEAENSQYLHWLILKNHPFYKDNAMEFVSKLKEYACDSYIVELNIL